MNYKKSDKEISYEMSRIKGKNTRPELLLRKALYKKGLRYRVNCKSVKGTPDIFFPKDRLAVFVDGDFWHGRDWAIAKRKIKSNKEYWIPKIESNMKRDIETTLFLEKGGYTVIRL
jgi:DNA mismatch endonuclease (patch repair protein)